MQITLNKNLIVYDLEAKTRKEVISKLADMLIKQGIVTDKPSYLAAVEAREAEGTTGIGDGIAIPHGKAASVRASAVVVAKLKQPVEWAALDGNPVKYVFLLSIPEDGDNEHLEILAEIASKLMDEDVRDALSRAESAEDLGNIFG
jgi:fructose-specific phosphotransferase system IIA component